MMAGRDFYEKRSTKEKKEGHLPSKKKVRPESGDMFGWNIFFRLILFFLLHSWKPLCPLKTVCTVILFPTGIFLIR